VGKWGDAGTRRVGEAVRVRDGGRRERERRAAP
jgi:hypothetical protein